MGRMIELNTMLRLKDGDIDLSLVKPGEVFNVVKTGTRIYPMNLSILLLDEAWNALGYCMITKTTSNGEQMDVTFQVLSVFTQEEREVVTRTMLEGLDRCGYER